MAEKLLAGENSENQQSVQQSTTPAPDIAKEDTSKEVIDVGNSFEQEKNIIDEKKATEAENEDENEDEYKDGDDNEDEYKDEDDANVELPPSSPPVPPPEFTQQQLEDFKKELETKQISLTSFLSEIEKISQEYETALKNYQTFQQQADDLQQFFNLDFGPNREFSHLYKQFHEIPTRDYTYKLCHFDKANQDHTSLGNWEGWSDNYTVMKYTGGVKCWDGPERSLTVNLKCGKTNEIVKIEEPSRCEYTMVMTTPSVCDSKHADVLELENSVEFEDNP